MTYDAAIIGGGIAGSQAALTLARSRRRVILFDGGQPAHAASPQMHNLLGADGMEANAFYARAREQLAQYPEITFVKHAVMEAARGGAGFVLTDAGGTQHAAKKILFACGVKHKLPPIPGLAEQWGKRVVHCNYCHGYEARDGVIGAITTATDALALAHTLLPLSSQLHFFMEGTLPDAALTAQLQALGIAVELRAIDRVSAEANGLAMMLSDGRSVPCGVLFVQTRMTPASELPFALGCQRAGDAFVATNGYGATHAPDVFAAGDMVGGFQQLSVAAASGALAAISLNAALAHP